MTSLDNIQPWAPAGQTRPADARLPALAQAATAPPADQPLFVGVCLLLASYFYTIPVIRTPLGMMTWLRLDDLLTILLVVTALMSHRCPAGVSSHPIGKTIIVILLLMPASVFFTFMSTAVAHTRKFAIWEMAKYIEYFIVLAIVSRLTITPRRMAVLVSIILAGSTLNGVVGILQVFGALDPAAMYRIYLQDPAFMGRASYVRQVRMHRWDQALGLLSYNYVALGSYMVIGLAFVTIALSCRGARLAKLLAVIGIVPIAGGLGLTGSRTALAMLLVGVIAFLLVSRRRVLALVVMIVALALTAYAALQAEVVTTRIERLVYGFDIETAGGGRIRLWAGTIRHLLARPHRLLLGYGQGTFEIMFYQPFGFVGAHSTYILALGEYGLVGLIVWGLLQTRITRLYWALAFRARHLSAQVWGRGMLAMQAALLSGAALSELFTPHRSIASFLGYYCLLLGLSFAVWRDIAGSPASPAAWLTGRERQPAYPALQMP